VKATRYKKIKIEMAVKKLPIVIIELQLAYPSGNEGILRGIPAIPI